MMIPVKQKVLHKLQRKATDNPWLQKIQRYITMLDGQDDFWLRGEPWRSTVSTIMIEFVAPSSFSGNQYLYDTSGTGIRAYCLLNNNTGFINTNGSSIKLNGSVIANSSAAPVPGKINRLEISYSLVSGFFVGIDIFGARLNLTEFASFPILSIMLTDEENSANTYTYKLSSNLPYELPLGEEDTSATTKLTLQNSEPDGSDRILVTRKEDNSGFEGENLITTEVYQNPASAQSHWSFSNGIWSYVGDGTLNALSFLLLSENTDLMRVTFTITNFSGSGTALCSQNFVDAYKFSSNGRYSILMNKQDAGLFQFKRAVGVCSFGVSDVTATPIYDYAPGASQ